jgi:hypothetical protein
MNYIVNKETLLNLQSNDPSLTQLTIWGRDSSIITAMEYMKNNTHVSELEMKGSLTKESQEALINMLHCNKYLKQLHVWKVFEDREMILLLETLSSNTSITSVIFGYENIAYSWERVGLEASKSFGEYLHNNNTLKEMKLWYCIFNDDGVAMFNALKTNHSLVSLDLHGCTFERGWTTFAQALQVNTTLNELNIHECFGNYQGDAVREVFSGLKANRGITSLACGGDGFNVSQGFKAVGEVLATSQFLNSLHLRSCGCGTNEMKTLSDGMTFNTALTELDLSSNRIGSEGVAILGNMLSTNRSLKSLVVHDCSLVDNDLKKLASSMKPCYLERLDIRNNSLTDRAVRFLLKIYKRGFDTYISTDLESYDPSSPLYLFQTKREVLSILFLLSF